MCAWAVCFLWHFPWGRPRRLLAGTVFPWSPDFPLRTGQNPADSGRPAVWRARHARGSIKRQAAPLAAPFASRVVLAIAARPVRTGGGRIAQLVEQLTLNQRAVGSNPTAPTKPRPKAYRPPGRRCCHPHRTCGSAADRNGPVAALSWSWRPPEVASASASGLPPGAMT